MTIMIHSKRHPKKKESVSEKLPQSEGNDSPKETAECLKSKGQSDPSISESQNTAEKIAEEHGISEKTVKRSADLFRSRLHPTAP